MKLLLLLFIWLLFYIISAKRDQIIRQKTCGSFEGHDYVPFEQTHKYVSMGNNWNTYLVTSYRCSFCGRETKTYEMYE